MPQPVSARLRALAAILVALAAFIVAPAAHAAGTSTISGTAFQDLNRDGLRQSGEAPFSGHKITATNLTTGVTAPTATTDADGHYTFTGLSDGNYRVDYEVTAWWSIRADWVSTYTGSLRGTRTLSLAGSATADFGWRPIVKSTDVAQPIATYVSPEGLRVETFNDVLSPQVIYNALKAGWVGTEAPYVTVRFAWGTSNVTSTSVQKQSNGVYTGYHATSYVTYTSWMDYGDQTLSHEYGHAWSLYHANIDQQDPAMSGYLQARGLLGDPRVDSSNSWDRKEMIAEDYRQLFGSSTARTRAQSNGDIPTADQVAGLREYLQSTFATPTATSPEPPPTAPAFDVTGLTVNPTAVKTSGTVSFTLSAPAATTVRIFDSKGATVRTLMSGAQLGGGSGSTQWDRLSDSGRKAGRGTYTARVDATDANGTTVTRTVAFNVS